MHLCVCPSRLHALPAVAAAALRRQLDKDLNGHRFESAPRRARLLATEAAGATKMSSVEVMTAPASRAAPSARPSAARDAWQFPYPARARATPRAPPPAAANATGTPTRATLKAPRAPPRGAGAPERARAGAYDAALRRRRRRNGRTLPRPRGAGHARARRPAVDLSEFSDR